jgi:hydrogenase-4 component B
MSLSLVLLGIGITAASGVPGLLLRRDSASGQWISAALAAIGSILGLSGAGLYWATGESRPIVLPWPIPGAEFNAALDGLSAFFLMPIFLIPMLGVVYGLGYWKQSEHPDNAPKLQFFYWLLTAGMGLLVLARNAVLFLFAWEIMALSAFFLVATEDEDREVRKAGWIYLVATHTATLCLFAMFMLLRTAGGSFTLAMLEDGSIAKPTATMILVLALVGFGIKAGIMPLHVWLPGAHAMAPSHVSAVLSGVFIKMGIYGLVRITSLFPHPPVEWGAVVLALGAVSSVLGVAYAVGQHDLKRLLAYHSIENIGIIVMGLGLALMGRSLDRADWVILGLGGALLHVWNHALFKALLFFSAGSVIHAVHTREIDHLGGLAKRMPWTALCFLIGAVAICGLPPLNGFVSEFLIYLGLFRTLTNDGGWSFAGAAFAAPALALIGALAVACFVKVYGAVFLGSARSEHAEHGHESPPSMVGPMIVLVGCCVLIGMAPILFAPVLGDAVRAWAPGVGEVAARLTGLAPLAWTTGMSLLLVSCLLGVWAVLKFRLRRTAVESAVTWGCGYVAPTARMQYTSSSFAQMLVYLFAWALRPRIRRPADLPIFPEKTAFHSDVPDAVLDEAVLPAVSFGAWLFSWARAFQRGSTQLYLLYIFIALIVLLLWR